MKILGADTTDVPAAVGATRFTITGRNACFVTDTVVRTIPGHGANQALGFAVNFTETARSRAPSQKISFAHPAGWNAVTGIHGIGHTLSVGASFRFPADAALTATSVIPTFFVGANWNARIDSSTLAKLVAALSVRAGATRAVTSVVATQFAFAFGLAIGGCTNTFNAFFALQA